MEKLTLKLNLNRRWRLSDPSAWLALPVSRCTCLRAASPSASAGRVTSSRRAERSSSVSTLQLQLYVFESSSAPVGIFYQRSPPNVTFFIQVLETPAEAMGAFGVLMRILQYAGLYIQLNAALNVGHGEVDNHISGNGKLFKALWLSLLNRSGWVGLTEDWLFFVSCCLFFLRLFFLSWIL